VERVDAFKDSGVSLKVLGVTKPMRQWEVMGELRRRLKKAFDAEHIDMRW
jgi:small conductance mechanosensitive channel